MGFTNRQRNTLLILSGIFAVAGVSAAFIETRLLAESRLRWIERYQKMLKHVPLEVLQQELTNMEFEKLTKDFDKT